MYRYFIFFYLVISPFLIFGQNQEKAKIQAVINEFFDGMRESDSLKIVNTIGPNCSLRTIFTNSNNAQTIIHDELLKDFLIAVTNKPEAVVYDEQILSFDINIDGRMGIAWTPYRFYINDEFSHCGVNVFSLALLEDKWKIIGILDTRRKNDCKVD